MTVARNDIAIGSNRNERIDQVFRNELRSGIYCWAGSRRLAHGQRHRERNEQAAGTFQK